MFKKLKLWQRIGGGFAILLVIAVALGILAIVNMGKIETQSISLQNEYVPEVDIANQIERSSLETMYAMRGYGLSGSENYLNDARKSIAQLKKELISAKDLDDRSENLKKLKPAVEEVEVKLAKYEELVDQTVESNAENEEIAGHMDRAAADYMENCAVFLDGQNDKMREEIANVAPMDKLNERLQKITLINDIIDIGNATRIAAFKAQARRNLDIINEAEGNFDQMESKFAELSKITYELDDLERIANIQKAAQEYQGEMNEYLEIAQQTQQLGKQRDDVGTAGVAEVRDVATAGMEGTVAIAAEAVSSLGTASNVMIGGLTIAAVIG